MRGQAPSHWKVTTSSFVLFAERSNPTLGFYDRMGGERLLDDRGQFHGAYGWRDVGTLLR